VSRGPDLGPAPNRLEVAMAEVATGRAEEALFFRRLYEAELVLPDEHGERVPFAEPRAVAEGEDLALPTGRMGDAYGLIAYSSAWQLRHALGDDQPALVLPMALLQSMWHSEVALLLNPGGTLGTRVDAIQVRSLPEPLPERLGRLDAGAEVVPLAPDDAARAALAPLWTLCQSVEPIGVAYSVGLRSGDTTRPAIALAVADQRVVNDVMLAVGALSVPLPDLQVVAIDPSAGDDFSASVLRVGVLVWERRSAPA
jgi:type III secretion system (T3SS) SseB-like protein